MSTSNLTAPTRLPKPSVMVLSGYISYVAVGWFLSGLGAVLPALEQRLGPRSALFQLLPGAVLLTGGVLVALGGRGSARAYRPRDLGAATVGLSVAVALMGLTDSFGISLVGAVGASLATAALIRVLPAVFAIECPDDSERVLTRANAWSSLAAIAAPVAIGTSIKLGFGWLAGMELLLVVAAIVVAGATRSSGPVTAATPDGADGRTPPLAMWWAPWAVLWLSIVIEYCFANYASTYLVDEVGLSIAAATSAAAAWSIGMTVGRFVLSTWTPPRSILPTAALIGVGFVLLWAVATPAAAITGFGVAGLGASPLFPTRAAALLRRFQTSPSHGSTLAAIASGAALLTAPALMAVLRNLSNVRTAYLIVPVLLIVLVALDAHARRASRTPAH